MDPKISVVMSVYNGDLYLRKAIDSILNQTFTNFEFIIIDDGSTDKSASIIKSYDDPRIVLIQQQNKGLALALNTGIKAAKGKYIARMDADDISHIERLQYQFKYMEKNKDCVALGTEAMVIDENGNYIYTIYNTMLKDELRMQLPEKNPYIHGSMMIRNEILKKCGGYKEDVPRYCDDDFLWIDLQKYGDLYNLNVPLYFYRIHTSAVSIIPTKLKRRLREIRIKYFDSGVINQEDIFVADKIRNANKMSDKDKRSYYHLRVGTAFLHHNNRHIARKHLIKSLRYSIISAQAWFNLILSFCPDGVILSWQRFRKK